MFGSASPSSHRPAPSTFIGWLNCICTEVANARWFGTAMTNPAQTQGSVVGCARLYGEISLSRICFGQTMKSLPHTMNFASGLQKIETTQGYVVVYAATGRKRRDPSN